jgi:phosphatidylethanolamine/phosphatidyl-N-methylethanolamine N-methyltransferase
MQAVTDNAASELDGQKRIYRIWARFYDTVYVRLLARAQREAVAAAAACGPDILEIGVGTGLTLPYFPATSRVVGADLSEDMLRVAQAKCRERNLAHVKGLCVMDACRLGAATGAFDAVTAQFVITLVPSAETALEEMDRVLKPGGEIIISSRLTDATGVSALFWKAVSPLARAVGWSSDFPVSRITDWAQATGRYDVAHVGKGYFKVVRLKKRASRPVTATA